MVPSPVRKKIMKTFYKVIWEFSLQFPIWRSLMASNIGLPIRFSIAIFASLFLYIGFLLKPMYVEFLFWKPLNGWTKIQSATFKSSNYFVSSSSVFILTSPLFTMNNSTRNFKDLHLLVSNDLLQFCFAYLSKNQLNFTVIGIVFFSKSTRLYSQVKTNNLATTN